MKRSFLALLPGLSGLGPSVSTEGNSDVVRPGGLAPVGWSLGGLWLGRLECYEGMAAKGVLENTVSLCAFLPWTTRTEEAELKLRLSPALQRRHLPSSWSLSVFSVVSGGSSVTCSPSEDIWGISVCSQRELLVAPGCQTLLPADWGCGVVGLGSIGFMADLMILKLLANLNYSVIL